MGTKKAAWSADLQSRVTDVAGVRLHDQGAGHGPPLVFVHGVAASSSGFIPLIKALAPYYACRAVDLPGFGSSDDSGGVLDVAGLADVLAAWLQAAGLRGAVLVGSSSGCQVIAHCAARHPELTGPLVLIGPTGDPHARGRIRHLLRWLRTRTRADITHLPLAVAAAGRAGWGRVARTSRFLLTDAFDQTLPRITQPTLILRGSADAIVPRRWAVEATALLPDGRWETIAGGAHLVHYTLPQSVGLLIREFLADIGWPR